MSIIANMKTPSSDDQLEYELQELFISSKQWLADISFMNHGIRFFKHLIDEYFVPGVEQGYEIQVWTFRKKIPQNEQEIINLKIRVIDYLKFLRLPVTDPSAFIGINLIETHTVLENEIRDLFESIKSIKKNLFVFIEKTT